MKGEAVLNEIERDATTFIANMCYRSMTEIEQDVMNHDGNVVLANQNKLVGKHDIWRAMYEAVSEPDTEVLMVPPNPEAASGSLLLVEDEIERSPFSENVWGFKCRTESMIEFENGSSIIAQHGGDEKRRDRLRGYHSDLLIVDNWTENGYKISDQTKEEVLLPMLETKDNDVWIQDLRVNDDCLTRAALQQGAYVKHMDHG